MNNSTTAPSGARRVTIPDLGALLTELAASGKSKAAFAREHGIPPWKLYHALRVRSGTWRNGTSDRRGRSAVIPVRVVDQAASPAPLELVFAGGYCVRIPSGFDETTLRRLMGVLGQC